MDCTARKLELSREKLKERLLKDGSRETTECDPTVTSSDSKAFIQELTSHLRLAASA
jgi:hypothetical protein